MSSCASSIRPVFPSVLPGRDSGAAKYTSSPLLSSLSPKSTGRVVQGEGERRDASCCTSLCGIGHAIAVERATVSCYLVLRAANMSFLQASTITRLPSKALLCSYTNGRSRSSPSKATCSSRGRYGYQSTLERNSSTNSDSTMRAKLHLMCGTKVAH